MSIDTHTPAGHATQPAGAGKPAPRRRFVFALVTATSLAAVAGYAWHVVSRTRAAAAAASPVAATPLTVPATGLAALSPTRPFVLFRSTALGDSHGRVSLSYLDALGEPRLVSALPCERVHFAAGTGICLEARRSGLTTYHAHVFDAHFAIRHSQPLAGPPSRARMSRDGRMAAFTVFVSGHSYATPGFTTRTTVIDTASGQPLVADLEAMTVLRGGAVFKAADFNFWGVSFARDGKRFYASLGSGGKVYLVEGDLAAKQMRVLHDDVECPSLSPDETRIAFKRRAAMDAAGRRLWRLVVLELATGAETLLGRETRDVDDQVEWLDDGALLYAMPKDDPTAGAGTDLWAIDTRAAAAPRLWLPSAFSPAVVQ